MLENSGLVLGVDSSLGLLTWFHNPRYVGMALLVHRRLFHLVQKDRWVSGRSRMKRQLLNFSNTHIVLILHIIQNGLVFKVPDLQLFNLCI